MNKKLFRFTIPNFSKRNFRGFTLIELMIGVSIIFILLAVTVLHLNPNEFIAQSKDAQRISDLKRIDTALSLAKNSPHESLEDNTAPSLVYISLPDTSIPKDGLCSEYPDLPLLASGWQYRCMVDDASLKKVDGSGWIPINFDSISGNPLKSLPIDPVNNETSYYTFSKSSSNPGSFVLAAPMKSEKYEVEAVNDGGNWNIAYETRPVEWVAGPVITFIKTIGGGGNDYGYSAVQTSDAGYIVAGAIRSYGAGNADISLSKFNSSGNLSWLKTVGGASDDIGYSVSQTSDAGYIVAGGTASFSGSVYYDLFLLKFDSSGNLSWSKTVGGTANDNGYSVSQTSDAGYIVAGTTNIGAGGWDIFLLKFDSSGNLSWSKTVGGAGEEFGYSVSQTSDAGYIVAGHTSSVGAGGTDILLLKFDSSGNLSWSKTVGGTANEYSYGESVSQTSDAGYIVAGHTSSVGAGGTDILLLKFDSSGNLSWSKTVGGTANDYSYSISQTSDAGYIVTGQTSSFGTGGDLLLLKFDSSGNLSWSKTVGGASYDYGHSVSQTSDAGYIVTGYTGSFGAGGPDIFLLKFDSSGDISDCSYVSSQTLSAIPQTLSAIPQTLSAIPQTLSAIPQTLSAIPQTPIPSTVCP